MSAPVSRLAQRVFLPPEPAPGTVVCWQQRFTPDGPVYTYAAVHVAGRGWYVTDDSETPYTWPELNYWLIGQTHIYAPTSWAALA